MERERDLVGETPTARDERVLECVDGLVLREGLALRVDHLVDLGRGEDVHLREELLQLVVERGEVGEDGALDVERVLFVLGRARERAEIDGVLVQVRPQLAGLVRKALQHRLEEAQARVALFQRHRLAVVHIVFAAFIVVILVVTVGVTGREVTHTQQRRDRRPGNGRVAKALVGLVDGVERV